jgi:hypothetical protein
MPIDGPPTARAILGLWGSQRPRSKQIAPGPSDLGGCPRKYGYKHARTEPVNISLSTQADIGTAVHDRLAEIGTGLKATHPDWLFEHSIEFDGMWGRVDFYADGWVTDFKTTSTNAAKSISVHGPYTSQLYQISTYAAGLIKQGHPVSMLRLDYLIRDSGKELLWEAPFDLRIVREAMAWKKNIESTPLELLPRAYAPDSVMCQGCPFGGADGGICWQGSVPNRDKRSVMYADDKAEIAEEIFQLRAQIKALNARAAEAKGILDAVRPDDGGKVVCGDRAVRWTGPYNALTFVSKDDD